MYDIQLGKQKQYLQCFSSNTRDVKKKASQVRSIYLDCEFRDRKLPNKESHEFLIQSKADAEEAGGAGVSR